MNNNKDIDYQAKLKKPFFGRFWFKKALKHIAVGAVSLGMVAGALFGFAGCVKSENPGPTIPPVDPNPPIITPNPDDQDDQDKDIEDVVFDEFMTNHKEEGVAFFNEYLKPAITEGKGDILAESINFDAADNEEALEHISYAYIYKNGDTARKYDVVDVQLNKSITFNDILNDKVTANDVIPIIQTPMSFDFDAKENVEKSDLTKAIYGRMCKMSNKLDASAKTYFGNVTPGYDSGYDLLTYNILSESNGKLSVNTITFFDKNLDEAQFIESLNDDAKFDNIEYDKVKTQSCTIQGVNIYKSEYKAEYEKEDVGPENPGHETEKNIENVEDLVTNYSTELNQGLQGAYDHITEKIFPNKVNNFDETKITESKWNLNTNENGAISKLNYFGKYDDRVFFVASVDLEGSEININALNDKNIVSELQKAIKGAAYNFDVQFNYNKEAMSQNPTLAEKVFEKEGLKEEGATYYITSVTPTVSELGRVKTATILQVSSKGVKQMSIEVVSDGDLTTNVENGSYKASDKSSYDFGDYTFNAETNKVATTSLSLYNEETGKYNIEDFGDELLF